ncbi:MAG: hypothetical protein P8H05_05130, partial [Schleiferiaceae bacterium]|nr:hypothetical protein [Schleiferiaceae bacterium]
MRRLKINAHFSRLYLGAIFIFASAGIFSVLPSFVSFVIFLLGVLFFSAKMVNSRNALFHFLVIGIFCLSFLSLEVDIVTIPVLNIGFNGL